MNAKEARKLTESSFLNGVHRSTIEKIEKAASAGQTFVNILYLGDREAGALRELGYDVEYCPPINGLVASVRAFSLISWSEGTSE